MNLIKKLFGIKEQKFWTTKEGQQIAYEDLTDNHLLNILNMLKRVAEREMNMTILMMVRGPFVPRGDAAQMAAEDAMNDLANSDWTRFRHKAYDELLMEASRRKLRVPLELIPAPGNYSDQYVEVDCVEGD